MSPSVSAWATGRAFRMIRELVPFTQADGTLPADLEPIVVELVTRGDLFLFNSAGHSPGPAGRPRTVLGCLVGRACPSGRRGLAPRVRLPVGLAGPAVPGRAWGRGCSGAASSGGWSAGRRRSRSASRRARWPSARRPIATTAGPWRLWRGPGETRSRGASQSARPPSGRRAGSTAMTARPALAAIWTSRSRNPERARETVTGGPAGFPSG